MVILNFCRTKKVMAPPGTARKIMENNTDPEAAETAQTTDSPAVDPSTACYAFEVGEVVKVNAYPKDLPYTITSRGINAFDGPNYSGTNALNGRMKRVSEHFLSRHNEKSDGTAGDGTKDHGK